jgi:GNAT superfamily N-acetyltransferase
MSDRALHIRKAGAEDVPEIYRLIRELAEFERAPEAVEVNEEDLLRDGFGEDPRFECLLAERDGAVAGMAFYYYRYSTWKGTALHLEDLIVSERYRGQGIGSRLLDEIVALGRSQGLRRIYWEVLDWNRPAIEFYESRGACIMEEWRMVHLDEAGIRAYPGNNRNKER